MKTIALILIFAASNVVAQVNPFGAISGNYKVVSCSDTSPTAQTPYSAQNLCNSKTVFIGELPGGDGDIGARFVDIDYVVFGAKCGSPVICSQNKIISERNKQTNPELMERTLVTQFNFIPLADGKLKIQFRRQILPKQDANDLDTKVEMVIVKVP